MINKWRSPNLRHVTRTHRVDLFLFVFQWVNVDHFILTKCVRTNDQVADILTRGLLATMQWHSSSTSWQIRRRYESNEVRSFYHKPLSCSALGEPQAMSQVTTQPENVDQISSLNTHQVLQPGCALDNHLTLEQLSSCDFNCTQDKRDRPPERGGHTLAGWYFIPDLEKTINCWYN